jgi:hypothetical protein
MLLADSKPDSPGINGDHPVCKIIPIKNALVTMAGMIRDWSPQLDPADIAAKAFDSPGNFAAHVKLATERIQAKASEDIARLKTEAPERYASFLKNGADGKSSGDHEVPLLAILFLGFENHVAMLAERKFYWNEAKSKIEIRKHDCPGQACPDGHYVSRLGAVSELDKFLATHKQADLGETTLHDLLVQQAHTTPKETALPIQILSLQESGPIWLANDLGCSLQK